jgi:hypothetical protein
MFSRSSLLALGVGFIVTGSALTAPPSPEDNVVYQKKTVIILDGSNIDGEREAPQLGDISVRKATKFSKMIRIRGNFRVELLSSVSQL